MKGESYAVGVAWPSFTLSGSQLAISPLLLANSGCSLNSIVSISTLAASGVVEVEGERMGVIYDGKGKGEKDSFFEAYVREVICTSLNPHESQEIVTNVGGCLCTVDIKYVAVNHFIEVVYNGITRRLLVSSLRGQPPIDSTPASTTKKAEQQIFVISRSTIINFKPPQASLPKRKIAKLPSSSSSAAVVVGGLIENGGAEKKNDMGGYESIGGMEAQIEQIRELVEWPLTRPELYNHFGQYYSYLS